MEQIFTPQDCPQVPPFGPSCEFGAKSPESRLSRNECDEWHFGWNFLRQLGKTYGLRYLVWLANLLFPFFAGDLFGNVWTIQLFAYLVWASNHVPMTNIPKSEILQVTLEFQLITTVASEFPRKKKKKNEYVRISMNIPWKNGFFFRKTSNRWSTALGCLNHPTCRSAFMLITRPRTWWKSEQILN